MASFAPDWLSRKNSLEGRRVCSITFGDGDAELGLGIGNGDGDFLDGCSVQCGEASSALRGPRPLPGDGFSGGVQLSAVGRPITRKQPDPVCRRRGIRGELCWLPHCYELVACSAICGVSGSAPSYITGHGTFMVLCHFVLDSV